MDNMKTAICIVKEGLSAWWDEIASLQTIVAELKTELASLKEKNDDLEGRMRRCNVRIAGIPEETGLSSIVAVFKLLKEVLSLEKGTLINRSHRNLTPKKPNGKPRVIIAKFHYYQDCVEVLCQAREQGPLRYKGEPIAIFPDYTASVARAWAAFSDVRNLLRGMFDTG
ncbi:putative transposase element L1Md-A101/L1Md-A102/L1Md-A2 [Labeo rohita]|uniref:Putative transposase element L1Md-A101/L1Md-A102/L1Md-A2 n=1 Tax=Labeo rohita TaxID=84645 RepID=A0A498LZ00_LABRO|nr:putative transposase element L1Md-A101/L1Md-A102/L1Md-A2 [Labeo rohita]